MVNVIIPVYKAKDTLPYTLNSLVAQTKRHFITTLVQDCDGEDYTELIEEYKRRGLMTQLIQLDHNVGPGLARQAGIDATQCDYIMFCDADDMYFPEAVEILYREARKGNYDVVYSSTRVEEAGGPGGVIDVKKAPVTWCGGKIYKTDYLKNNQIRFIKELRLNEDSYFNLVAINSTTNRAKIDYITYFWRDNKNSLTRRESSKDFFIRSSEQYIISQIYGLDKIELINGTINDDLITGTLVNIYDAVMRRCHYQLDNDVLLPHYYILRNIRSVSKWAENGQNWINIMKLLKAGYVDEQEGEIIFFKQRFVDWFKESVCK